MNQPTPILPPITLNSTDLERLRLLANAAAESHPDAADFLSQEVDRAVVVDSAPPGVVAMGSRLSFRDESTGQVRHVSLVYPEEADIAAGKISVLTPIGAALIGLSVGQSIEWQTPAGARRSLTVLEVDGRA